MTYYHFSTHQFNIGDIVEPRVSFPYPYAWAWATTSLEEASKARGEGYVFIVQPLGELEPSPHHEHSVRSKQGFKVIGAVSD
jgi:hypothetical protein